MMKKKRWLLMCVLALAFCVGTAATVFAAQSPQIPLPGTAIPKYVNQLPLLNINPTAPYNGIYTTTGNRALDINMCEFDAKILPTGTPLTGNPGGVTTPITRVFGYIVGACPDLGLATAQDTYIGPVILNGRGLGSTNITFVNNLPTAASTGVSAFKFSTDQTMHWADPLGILSNPPENNACKKALEETGTPPVFGSPCAENYLGPIPAVPHLHGGEVPPELDGGPDAWWTSTGVQGHAYYTFGTPPPNAAIYKYPNTQEAGPIWFHDHVLGITRLNVYAGLAGAYLIYDPLLSDNAAPDLPLGLHPAGLWYPTATPTVPASPDVPTIPLVIQDRMFDTAGQLFYTTDSAGGVLWATNPEHPYWTPEFLGDVIVVNGKAWPNLNVEPKRYRFWLINGSNARTYEMYLQGGPNMWVIATDGGYLDSAVQVTKLVMMPGERYEVIMDFAGIRPGKTMIMKNTAKSPYPAGVSPSATTNGQIMQFTVVPSTLPAGMVDNSYNPAVTPAILPAGKTIVRLPTTFAPATTRLLSLNEVMGVPKPWTDPVTGALTAYPGGPLEVLVNNTKYGGEPGLNGRTYGDFTAIPTPIPGTGVDDVTEYSELPIEGTTEMWEIVNLTADAHPIHLHLVQFQIINRQNYNFNTYNKVYNQAFPGGGFDFAIGGPYPPNVFIPGWGPPLPYDPGIGVTPPQVDNRGGKWGGNPDVFPYLQGKAALPLPQEAGWKDTVVAFPGQVTRLAVRWAPTDLPIGTGAAYHYPFDPNGAYSHGYVWHCHIIDHEDNEMMRPFSVTLNSLAPIPELRSLKKGINY